MELIKINDKKLKVTLSDLDMKCYNLKSDNIDYDCPSTKTALKRLLRDVGEQSGFDTDDDKIFLQIYPGLRGGCEMYLTRLDTDTQKHTAGTIYSFDDMDALIRACRQLTGYGFREESRLYALGGRYLLLISEDYSQNNRTYSASPRGRALPPYPLLHEYGRRVRGEKYAAFIKEHGTLICSEKAVEIMGRL